VFSRIVQDLEDRGLQQTAGDIGYWYLLQALGRHGRHDLIYHMASRTNMGSYGFIVNNGWTAMPEAWDANTGASMNHCMLGHIQEWFLGHLAGVRLDPAAPAARRFIIAPQPVGAVTWARGRYESLSGPVSLRWETPPDLFTLSLTLPPNTTATVVLPTTGATGLKESGNPATEAKGVKLQVDKPGQITLEVGSGSYYFTGSRRKIHQN
jgi:hypothetical protein